MSNSTGLSKNYLEARSLFDTLTPAELTTYARVLYGYGYSPTDACANAVCGINSSVQQQQGYCIAPGGCSCDCHLSPEEYRDLHKTD